MTSHISKLAYGTDFSTILNEFWTDFLQFSAKDGGGVTSPPNPPLMCVPDDWMAQWLSGGLETQSQRCEFKSNSSSASDFFDGFSFIRIKHHCSTCRE